MNTLKNGKKRLSKEEKKELKRQAKERKVKAKQSRKNRNRASKERNNFYLVGGKYGDRDDRTKEGIRALHIRRISIFLLVVGTLLFVFKFSEMLDYMTNNSTPVGTELQFAKSGAPIKISEIWTDKNHEVTVVKLKYNKKARSLLSIDGDKYNLYFLHKPNHKPDIEMKYGLLGTEGDGYLFIKGKLDKRAYQIYMTNTLEINYDNTSKRSTDINVLKENEIEETLSNVSENTMNEDGVFKNAFKSKKKIPQFDNLNFRLNAYSENTKVYQGSFLDKKGEIDYGKVVSQTSLVNAVEKIENAIKEKKLERQSYTVSLEEYENRLKRNKKDEDTQSSIEKINRDIEKIDSSIKILEQELNRYKKATFSKDDFGKMQEKFEYYDIVKGRNK